MASIEEMEEEQRLREEFRLSVKYGLTLKARSYGFQFYKDVLAAPSDALRPQWRIQNVLPHGLTLLIGPPGVGKSLLVLGWAYHIVAGRPWFGRDVRRGGVVYLSPETSQADYVMRLAACRVEFPPELEEEPPFAVRLQNEGALTLNTTAPYGEMSDVDTLIEVVGDHMQNGVLIIDTLAAHFEGDENSSTDMNAFVRSVQRIRSALPGVDVVVVHHTTKHNNDERGHTALKGAVDLMLLLSSKLQLETRKSRGEPVPATKLRIKTVDIAAALPGWSGSSAAAESVVMVPATADHEATDPGPIRAFTALAAFADGATVKEWSEACGIPETSLRRKADKHWSASVKRRSDKKYELTPAGTDLLSRT